MAIKNNFRIFIFLTIFANSLAHAQGNNDGAGQIPTQGKFLDDYYWVCVDSPEGPAIVAEIDLRPDGRFFVAYAKYDQSCGGEVVHPKIVEWRSINKWYQFVVSGSYEINSEERLKIAWENITDRLMTFYVDKTDYAVYDKGLAKTRAESQECGIESWKSGEAVELDNLNCNFISKSARVLDSEVIIVKMRSGLSDNFVVHEDSYDPGIRKANLVNFSEIRHLLKQPKGGFSVANTIFPDNRSSNFYNIKEVSDRFTEFSMEEESEFSEIRQ